MEVEKVVLKNKEIVLVGTAHVSAQSVALAEKIIMSEHPDVVGVELDPQRYQSLVNEKQWKETNVSRIVREGKTYLFLTNLLLSGFQKKLGRELGSAPGSEMLAAIRIAHQNNARIALLDRDVTITLKRAFALTSAWEKARIGATIVGALFLPGDQVDEKMVEELKNQDTLNAVLHELSKTMPRAKKVLVDERDLFIANRILEIKARKVVAVVGMGHVQGIKKYLDKKRNIEQLLQVPEKKGLLWVIKYAIPLLVVALIALAFYSRGPEVSFAAIIGWIAINGVLSALGVVIARGHFFSVLTAFVAAPLTSLHPFLASGWVAGLVEAKMRSPRVKDFEHLQSIESYRDLPNNAVTRIFLVVALANIGSSLGTIIGISYIASLLA